MRLHVLAIAAACTSMPSAALAQASNLGTLYVYRVAFKTATLDWLFALNPAGKINGMFFRPEAPAS